MKKHFTTTVCIGLFFAVGVFATVAAVAQQNASELQQLQGPSRTITDEQLTRKTRAFHGQQGTVAATELPKQISIVLSDDDITVTHAADSAAAITFERSYKGETLKLSGGDPALIAATRGSGGNVPANETLAVAQSPVSLDQLLGQSMFRGTSMLTPAPGSRLLSGKATFRRVSDDGQPLQSVSVDVRNGRRSVLQFTIDDDTETIRWDDIKALPKSLSDGLPAGQYNLQIDGKPSGTFVVEDIEMVDWINEPIDAMADLTKPQPGTATIFHIESLISWLDEMGQPAPYLCDALDLIESIDPPTPYSQSIRRRVLAKLGQQTPGDQAKAEVGIESIDNIRALIAAGRWTDAIESANAIVNDAESNDTRTLGLAQLYSSVAQGQSSVDSIYSSDITRQSFLDSMKTIGDENPADAFRAHNNFANYLSGKAQSRIYNYALQSAADLDSPLLTALWYWGQAKTEYATAAKLADGMSPQDRAALSLNQARLYSTMGDFIRNLRSRDPGLKKILEHADSIVQQLATEASKPSDGEPTVRASAFETLANLAYRVEDSEKSKQLLTKAIEAYQAAGSLSGLASTNRTLGLIAANSDASDDAIAHMMIAKNISELLRQQVALNESGNDRAGYFAKYAYTNERLIELLIDSDDAYAALEVAEMSKARTFEDLLKRRDDASKEDISVWDEVMPTLDEALDIVDDDTLVVEFYVGGRYVFAFVVQRGEVTAHRLENEDGKPLVASEFIGRVAEFLSGMQGRARRMIVEARTANGFDKSWQHKLHQFYLELIPKSARESLAETTHLVVIPHHILHYFPFAALVTEVDDQELSRFQLPQPKFLVEYDLDITAAPSLRTFAYMIEGRSNVTGANAIGISEFDGAPRLPGVETDLANYQEVFGKRIGKMVRTKPITESQIVSVMNEPSLLFIGTHGQNEADRPLVSFLLCDSDQNSDGMLTAYELFGAEIQADAIVMSACFSGLADRSPLPGDDLFGLQRAMLQAGSRSIVSGLWDVYDDTAPMLMKSTMAHFASGNPMRSSLANAQRDFLADRKTKGPKDLWIHPYFWAVYNCSGSGHTTMTE
ncbi:CHAT domain protein [Planctomycetes bacterium CA13]|uniref:CHAT domain protein n=1 Tax=Novipirellula herctigrandis TaxID=2527986 RepID=A0A5C5ZC91_9BACT|nr:CHAT domain protein [Planctomycetes bacterium CA13]